MRNTTLCSEGRCRPADILIRNGVIIRISAYIRDSEIPGGSGAKRYNLQGCIVTRALADVHVHFRVPGRPDKETVATGSAAAARGGYSCVCPMPNLNPVPDSPKNLREELKLIRREGTVDIIPYASITKGREGREVVDIAALKGSVAGFSDDGSGVQDDAVMKEAMRRTAAEGCILAAHCEDSSLPAGSPESEWKQIARDAALAAETRCKYHVCHISTRESAEIIRKAKASGCDISCETAPHYLTLCEDDRQDDGRFKMNPPLHTAADREALIEALADGTIDMIATDHAPHTAEEKSRGFEGSAMGIIGLETAFPVLYTKLVRTGRITLEKLVEVMAEAPRRRFGLDGRSKNPAGIREGEAADLAVFDVSNEFTIDPSEFRSKGRSTPFEGWKVYGKCLLTFCRGRRVWSDAALAGKMEGAAGGGGGSR